MVFSPQRNKLPFLVSQALLYYEEVLLRELLIIKSVIQRWGGGGGGRGSNCVVEGGRTALNARGQGTSCWGNDFFFPVV